MDCSVPIVQPLSSQALRDSAIGKLDKETFIRSFIEEQKSNKKSYAAEGSLLSQAPIPSGFGFGTPILKSRKDKDTDTRSSIVNVPAVELHKEKEHLRGQKSQVPADISNPSSDKVASREKPIRLKHRKGDHSRQKHAITDSEDERVARLTARRERKRAKRATVQSGEGRERSDGENTPGIKTKTNSKSKKEKTNKTHAGFALMYGFSAANVGKNRLTLQPAPSMGVFNKGKASAKTEIVHKSSRKKPKLSNLFSEHAFLNKTRKVAHSVDATGSECSFQVSSVLSLKHDTVKKKPHSKGLRTIAQSPKEIECSRTSSPTSDKDPGRKSSAESLAWDIEHPDQALPSDVPSLCADKFEKKLLSNSRSIAPLNSCSCKKASPVYAMEELTSSRPRLSSPSSSLGPSQSASQCPRNALAQAHLAHVGMETSKYFTVTKPADDVPISAPSVSALTPADPVQAGPLIETTQHYVPRKELQENNTVMPDIQLALPIPPLISRSGPDRICTPHIDSLEEFCDFRGGPVLCTMEFGSSPTSLTRALLEYEADVNLSFPRPCRSLPSSRSQDPTETWAGALYHALNASQKDDQPAVDLYEGAFFDSPQLGDQVVAHGHEEPEEFEYSYEDGHVAFLYQENSHPHDFESYMDCAPTRSLEGALGGLNLTRPWPCSLPLCELPGIDYVPHADDLDCEEYWEDSECCNSINDQGRSMDDCELELASGDPFYEISSQFSGPRTRPSSPSPSITPSPPDGYARLGPLTQRFSQGRALLLGLPSLDEDSRRSFKQPTQSKAEADVARQLKGHWLPQKI